MQIYQKEIDILFGKKRFKISYTYNNQTKYQDLLEYVFSLFPDMDLCPCYIFANENDYINSDTLINESNDINNTLVISNMYSDSKCHCDNKNIKTMLRKRKREIIEQFNNDKNGLEMNDKQNNESINNLKKEKEDQLKIISKLRNEINSLNKKLDISENKINILEEEKNEKEKIIDELQKQKNILELSINGNLGEIDKLKKLGVEVNYKGENMISINPDNNQIIGKQEIQKVDFLDFYDIIINIKSIKDINKGWEIKMNEK